MEARVHPTIAEFRTAAWPLISADPVRQTVMLTALRRTEDAPVMITLHDNEELVGAVIQIPPYPMLTSAMPVEAAETVAKAVQAINPELRVAGGPVERVEAFVEAWTRLTGTTARQTFALRLFELGELKPPAVEGQPRQATEDDLPLLTEWTRLFLEDSNHLAPTEPPEVQARRSLDAGVNIIWEVDGKPVAFAAARGPISGMVRVAPVYTPSELRGRGYASAVTAAVSQWAIDQGAEHILLYTDLSNPVTNRIYPRIGYQPLEDSAEYTFS
jgi:predicted GNAT family acetyltransferase